MKKPKISKRAKAKAAAAYLRIRAAYAKNYLAARYNQAIDRILGEGNYDAKIFFMNKVRNARAPLKEHRRKINKMIKYHEADLYILQTMKKTRAYEEQKARVDEAIARAQNVLKKLNEAKYIAITKQLALSSRETGKRLRSYKKYKKNSVLEH